MVNNDPSLKQERLDNKKEQHRRHLWTYYLLIAIGLWLVTGFIQMGSEKPALIWNDIIHKIMVLWKINVYL